MKTDTVPALALGMLLCGVAPATAAGSGTAYETVNLVSNHRGLAENFDPDLKNAWGVSHAPGGPLWVSANGSNTSTLYDRHSGQKVPLTVHVGHGGAPTGQVFVPPENDDGDIDFPIHKNGVKASSVFIFVTEGGTIQGWNPDVDLTHALIGVDNSAQGAVYKGVELSPGKETLFAADFTNNEVEMFDDQFHQIGAFTDTSLPKRFAPFNIAHLDGQYYVAFAKREKHGVDEIARPGLGYIDVFSESGHLLQHLISNGPLNAPWGMAIAPKDFGSFSGALLVGNFGDGKINAFNPDTGDFLGTVSRRNGRSIKIDGLWALDTGPGNRVTFTAGPSEESDGLVGYIQPANP